MLDVKFICPFKSLSIIMRIVYFKRLSMTGLSSKTMPQLADSIHAAVTRIV